MNQFGALGHLGNARFLCAIALFVVSRIVCFCHKCASFVAIVRSGLANTKKCRPKGRQRMLGQTRRRNLETTGSSGVRLAIFKSLSPTSCPNLVFRNLKTATSYQLYFIAGIRLLLAHPFGFVLSQVSDFPGERRTLQGRRFRHRLDGHPNCEREKIRPEYN